MLRFLGAGLLSLAGLIVAGLPASAEEGKPHVLLIGVSHYQNQTDNPIVPRAKAEKDAQALYDLFTQKDYLNTDKDHVHLLVGEKATAASIRKEFDWLSAHAGEKDLVIVGFFGAGAPITDGGEKRCYFAFDSTVKGRETDAISAEEIGKKMNGLKSDRVCVLLDVNFKGFQPEPLVSLGESPYREFLGEEDGPEKNYKPGRVLYTATTGLAAGLDLETQGLFAQAVLNGLKNDADATGGRDGLVTTEELASWLDKEMRRLSTKPVTRLQQSLIRGTENSRFPLTTTKYRPEVEKQLARLVQLAREGKISEALAREGQGLLERMPKLEAKRALRTEFLKLVEPGLSDDQLKQGLARLEEKRKELTKELPDEPAIKFARAVITAAILVETNYVKSVKLGELVDNAIRGLYRRLDEPLPEKLAVRLDAVKKMTRTELGKMAELLFEVRKLLGPREDLDEHRDIDIALQRMVGPLDPHTIYIGPAEKTRFEIDFKADYSGIGAQIGKDDETGYVRISTPIKDGPAYGKGIRADDLIVKITREMDSDGKALPAPETRDTKDMPLSEVVKLLLGKADTRVKITIRRNGEDKEIEIKRGRVLMETVTGARRLADDIWDYMLDDTHKIGYVRLTMFAPGTYEQLKQALTKLQSQGMKSLILDLRFNPGGTLKGAKQISDLFIEDQEIVSIRYRGDKEPERMRGERPGTLPYFPMVCLINGGSASASEIVSACLQDTKGKDSRARAVIMGERSFGKGSVQHVIDHDGGELKLTVAAFHRPTGRNLNKLSADGIQFDKDEWGVKPDVEIPLKPGEIDALEEALREKEIIGKVKKPDAKEFEDVQLNKALEHLKKK